MIVKQTKLGQFLRKRRIERNLTQTEVAKLLKCRSQFISNWERGDSSPPWRLLKSLIRIYSIPEQEIMTFLLDEQALFIRKQLGFNRKAVG